MYTIKAIVDGKKYTIHNPAHRETTVGEAYFSVGDNVNGEAQFTVYPDNPYYDKVQKLTTDIIIYDNGNPCFYGRVLYDDEDMAGAKNVFVEGELAFLCDSIQRPAEYHNISVADYFKTVIARHNSQVEERKQFVVGRVTVTDPNDSLYRYANYETTRETITDKLINRLGGHLQIRHEDGLRIIDYLSDSDFQIPCKQEIRFGVNLLDFAKNMDASDIVTCLIPLGAKLDSSADSQIENRLTISEVNGGVDYVSDDAAVAKYGKIYATKIWDDVTVASNLLRKGKEYLTTTQYEKMVLELKAIDLNLTDSTVEQLKIGQMIRCVVGTRSIDVRLPLSKKQIYLTDFSKNTVTLGKETVDTSYTSANRSETAVFEEAIKNIPNRSEILKSALSSATDLINTANRSGYAIHTPEEFIVADKPGATSAKNLWRWGLGGLAHYSDGYDGPADGVALTMDGKINGAMLLANSVKADVIDAGYREAIGKSIQKSQEDAISGANSYTDENICATETKLNNLNNKITLSVQSVRDSILQKNHVVGGEQETLSTDNFKITENIANISISDFNNFRCFKIIFEKEGIANIEQDIGTLPNGNYRISLAVAAEKDNIPKYIQYGFDGNRQTEQFSMHDGGEFFRLSQSYSITEASKTVSVGVYGKVGDVCYITEIRCLRSIDELLDDIYTAFTVADGNILAEVSRTYATNETIESIKNNVSSAQEKANQANAAAANAKSESEAAQAAADEAQKKAESAAQAAKEAEANAAEDASAKAEAARKAAEEAAAKKSEADAAAAKLAAAEDASQKANKALEDVKAYLVEKLQLYSTTEETKSLISQSSTEIKSEVSKTYTTKTEFESAKAAIDNAQKAADDAAAAVDTAKQEATAAQKRADEANAAAENAAQAAKEAEANAAEDASAKAEAARKAAEEAAAAQSAADIAEAKKSAAEDAQAKANEALTAAKGYIDTSLQSYSTTEETKSMISQTADGISLEVASASTSGNLLEYKQFEDYEQNPTQHASASDGILTVTFPKTDGAFYISEVVRQPLMKYCQGKCVTLSGYYKVIQPFDSGTSRISISCTYKSGNSKTIYYRENSTLSTAEQSADWIYYEKTYITDLLNEEIATLRMSYHVTPSKSGTDGEIQWKDWTLKIAPSVQSANVRSKFAMDSSSVTIDTGKLTFNSNSIVINSTNFKLDSDGNVAATGQFITSSGNMKSVTRNGGLVLYYDDVERGSLHMTVTGDSFVAMDRYYIGAYTGGQQLFAAMDNGVVSITAGKLYTDKFNGHNVDWVWDGNIGRWVLAISD